MVSPQQKEVLRVFDLVCQEQADGLQRLLPSVHVVSQEQVVGLWRKTTILKEPQEVCVLSMNITCDRGNGRQR